MNIPNGVKTDTIENTEFEAGLILKNKFTSYENFDKDRDVLCATTGGIRVAISQIKQVIKFDGVLDNTAGIERVVGWTSSVQFSTKELDSEKVKLALGYAGITTSGNIKTVTLKQGVIPVDDYQDFYLLGKLGDGTWRQIVINKAMNVNGLSEQRNDKNETEIAFDLQANYGIDTQDEPPVSIEYISEDEPEPTPSYNIELEPLENTDIISSTGVTLVCNINKTKDEVNQLIDDLLEDVEPVTGSKILYLFGANNSYPYLKVMASATGSGYGFRRIACKLQVAMDEVVLYYETYPAGWGLSQIRLENGAVSFGSLNASNAVGTLSGEGWNGIIIGKLPEQV